jgi:CubicO group peptidase (beta-lactamase class C family)
LLLAVLVGCTGLRSPPAAVVAASPLSRAALDAEVARLMKREGVVGLAAAVIEEGRVVQVAAYGERDAKRHLPLTVDTAMVGASLTKAVFAQLVMQLVDEGRLDLDRPIADLLPRPLPEYPRYADLAGEPRWRLITPRHLLMHAGGFANFRWLEPDQRLRIHQEPGTRYAYSGEGLGLLQFALEEGTGIDVAAMIQTRVFDRFGMTRTSMTWRDDLEADAAAGYRSDGSEEPHRKRRRADVAGSMDTTIADQASFWAAAVRGDGLSAAARAAWTRPGLPIASRHQFPTFLAPLDDSQAGIGLAAALGLVAFRDGSGNAWFKGGHDDGTANMAICFDQRLRCLVLLSNDVRAERLYPDLARFVLGPTAIPWSWEYAWVDPSRMRP